MEKKQDLKFLNETKEESNETENPQEEIEENLGISVDLRT